MQYPKEGLKKGRMAGQLVWRPQMRSGLGTEVEESLACRRCLGMTGVVQGKASRRNGV